MRTGITREQRGQSLVELALTLPVLLLLLLGVADLGRAYVYKDAITNAAREAAVYAARNPTADQTAVRQQAWNETGFDDYGSAPAASFTLSTCTCPSGGSDVTVEISYQLPLISGHMFDAVVGGSSLTVGAKARVPSQSN